MPLVGRFRDRHTVVGRLWQRLAEVIEFLERVYFARMVRGLGMPTPNPDAFIVVCELVLDTI